MSLTLAVAAFFDLALSLALSLALLDVVLLCAFHPLLRRPIVIVVVVFLVAGIVIVIIFACVVLFCHSVPLSLCFLLLELSFAHVHVPTHYPSSASNANKMTCMFFVTRTFRLSKQSLGKNILFFTCVLPSPLPLHFWVSFVELFVRFSSPQASTSEAQLNEINHT